MFAFEAVKSESYVKHFFFSGKKRGETVKRNCSFSFFFSNIVSAFGQWCAIQAHIVVLKNKLRNTWVVIFAAEGIVQLIVRDSGVQEANEK